MSRKLPLSCLYHYPGTGSYISADYLLQGAEDRAARARFEDDELLRQFQEVQGLAEGDKRLVKEFLGAFLTKKKLEQIVAG